MVTFSLLARSMGALVEFVLTMGTPSKIYGPIIQPVTIQMAYFVTLWTLAVECLTNEYRNTDRPQARLTR